MQLPQVQTFLTRKVTDALSSKLDGDIVFEKLHFKPFTTLVLKNAAIIDRNPATDPTDPQKEKIDTFFRAGYIIARFSLKGLAGSEGEGIHIRKAYIADARMNLVLQDGKDTTDKGTDNLSRIFRLKKNQKKKEPSPKELFHIRNVELDNMSFALINYKTRKTPYHGGMNWNDLDITSIDLKARDLMFKGGIMTGEVGELSFREKSGFECSSLTGKAKVGNGRTIVEDLKLKDQWSDIDIPLYMMSYDSVKDFSDYIDKVKMDGIIARSMVDFRTISYFAPQLSDNKLRVVAEGRMEGVVRDLHFYNISAISQAGGFSGIVNGSLTGLPDIDNTRINATVRNFHLTTDGLGRFVSEWMKGGRLDLSRFAKGTVFNVDASAKGLLNSMETKASISSEIGQADVEARLSDLIISDKPIGIDGTVHTEDLDLGQIIGTDIIHQTTLRTGLKAKLTDGFPDVVIDSLIVDRMNLNGYDYSGIAAVGKLSERAFDGRIICNDPSLNFLFQGTFALSSKTKNALYQFYANVGHADLNAMNIDKRGISRVQLQTNANFVRTAQGDLLGKVDVGNLNLENSEGKHDIGDISLTSHTNDNKWKVRLNSSFIDGSYIGTASVGRFIKDLKDITLRKEIPALFTDEGQKWGGNSYELYFRCHNSMDVMSFAIPGMYIADSTALNLNITPEGILTTELKSPRIAYREQYMKGVNVSIDNKSDKITGELNCSEIRAASLMMKDNRLSILAQDNHLGAGFSYENAGELLNRGEFVFVSDFSRNEEKLNIDLDILPTSLHLNSREWNIEPSKIHILGSDIDVETFELTSSEQKISLQGKASKEKKDTLTLNLARFDISVINPLLKSNLGIAGAATGEVKLISPLNEMGLLANMISDSTYVAGVPLGVVGIGSSWNEEFERFDISVKNSHLGKSNLNATAKFTPKSKMLDAALTLDSLNIKYAEPFLTDVFSEMEGYVSGDIIAEGPVNLLEIKSSGTRLDKAMLKVAFTNVPYYADGSFHIDDTGVWFDDISIRDRYNGTGTVEGSINWSQFKDITFDTRLKVRNIEGIDLTEKMNEDFYGNIYGTGNVSITGPVNSLVLTVDAVTAKTGQLHIPMSGAATSGGATNLLKFKEPVKETYIDPYEAMMARIDRKEQGKSDFLVKLRVEASPNVIAFVEIDKASGNVLSGQGNGLIELEAGDDIFSINGDYTLTGGKYTFSALGLVNRVFDIQDGSSINFSGDIMQSTLDIDAVYKTKASLSSLLSDESSVANRRNVECGIRITDKLSNPRLEFFIDVPDLNPMIKSRVESALSTEDKIQKQFLSLLLSNSFLPDEQSGIVNNSSMFYSNVTEAMANQLSNILHKLDIPLDLGLKYQPTDQGTDIFDVAVSTQLFNNRVVVNGNIGNKQYEGGGAQNDVVGDLDIEIKLNRSGAFRLNIFSHSADQYSNYLDNSQRNGVGLTYQTEFNSFRQFFRNLFSGKQKRQEARLAEQQELISGERVEFSIKEEDNRKSDLKKNDRK